MILVKQKTGHDCGICTIAMALDKPYDDVMRAALETKSFDPEEGMHAEYRVIEAFGLVQMKDFRTINHRILDPDFFRHFTWGRRAIMAVPSLNIMGGFHSVYWDGAKIFDPCTARTYTEWKDLRPIEIILFNEVRT